MVKILCVFRSLGPKLAKGFEYIGICDSCTEKCWRLISTGLTVVRSEFKCLIKIQYSSIEKFCLGENKVSMFGYEENKL